MGRPTEYQGEQTIMKVEALISAMTVEKFFSFCSVDHIAYALGVSRGTIYNWRNKHPEFLDTITLWETKRNVLFYQLAISPQVKPIVWIFLAKNFLGMKDLVETIHGGELRIKVEKVMTDIRPDDG